MMGIHHFETSTTASWKRSLDRKRPLGYHSNSYSWKGKERTPPFGQTARVCTGKQTNLGFSEGILPRQLEFSFFDGEVNVNFEWSTFCALGRRTREVDRIRKRLQKCTVAELKALIRRVKLPPSVHLKKKKAEVVETLLELGQAGHIKPSSHEDASRILSSVDCEANDLALMAKEWLQRGMRTLKIKKKAFTTTDQSNSPTGTKNKQEDP